MSDQFEDIISQGIGLMAAGQFKEARHSFERAIELDNRSFNAYVHLGNACVNMGELESGIDAFKKALMLDSTSNVALFGLASVYFLNNDYVNALKYFNRAEDNGYKTSEMYGIMSVIFLDSDDPTQALRCMNRAIALEPLKAEHRLSKAQIYLSMGQTKEAINCLREIEDILPDEGDAYIQEAEILVKMEDYDAALEVAERATSRFPQDPRLLLVKGRCLNEAKKHKEALVLLSEASQYTDSGDEIGKAIAMQISIARTALGDINGSIVELKKSVDQYGADEELLYFLMMECLSLEEYDMALDAAEQIVGISDVSPRFNAAALYAKGTVLKAKGDEKSSGYFKEIVQPLRKITVENPGLLDVYSYRILVFNELGQYDKALELADYLVSMAPNNAVGYAFRYNTLKESGDMTAAEEAKEKVLALDPEFNL